MAKKLTPDPFSITIKGAGTRQEIIDSLNRIIKKLKKIPHTELEEGMEVEGATLMLETDTYESYTGEPFKK